MAQTPLDFPENKHNHSIRRNACQLLRPTRAELIRYINALAQAKFIINMLDALIKQQHASEA